MNAFNMHIQLHFQLGSVCSSRVADSKRTNGKMDQTSPPIRHQEGLNLNEQQKQTIRALRRQISCHPTAGSSTTESGDHLVAKLNEGELNLLHNVVQTFVSYRADPGPLAQNIKGRKLLRDLSGDSFISTASHESGNFVNPKRFYVRVTREEVQTLEQVCIELDDKETLRTETKLNRTQNLEIKNLPLPNNENNRKNYGFSVAFTKQTDEIIMVENKTKQALPDHFTKQNFSLINGSAPKNNNSYRTTIRHLPPRERFKEAVYSVVNDLRMRPRKTDKDFSELWRKRGDPSWLSIFFTVVAIAAFFTDVGTDLKVAADHFTKGKNYWWGSLSLLLVVLPSVVTNLVSFFWYKEDDKEIGRPPKSGWKVVSITHLFLSGMAER